MRWAAGDPRGEPSGDVISPTDPMPNNAPPSLVTELVEVVLTLPPLRPASLPEILRSLLLTTDAVSLELTKFGLNLCLSLIGALAVTVGGGSGGGGGGAGEPPETTTDLDGLPDLAVPPSSVTPLSEVGRVAGGGVGCCCDGDDGTKSSFSFSDVLRRGGKEEAGGDSVAEAATAADDDETSVAFSWLSKTLFAAGGGGGVASSAAAGTWGLRRCPALAKLTAVRSLALLITQLTNFLFNRQLIISLRTL